MGLAKPKMITWVLARYAVISFIPQENELHGLDQESEKRVKEEKYGWWIGLHIYRHSRKLALSMSSHLLLACAILYQHKGPIALVELCKNPFVNGCPLLVVSATLQIYNFEWNKTHIHTIINKRYMHQCYLNFYF